MPAPRQDILWLSRVDHERAGQLPPAAVRGLEPVDWAHDPPGRRAGIRRQLVRMLENERWVGRLALPLRRRQYLALARGRMVRGCRMLATARTVVANRLHVHILCVMLGIPHFLSDTAHGKIGAYVRTWTAGWPGVHLCASEQEALTAALGRPA
jgi:pyruvyl transferase EpsO